MAQEKEADEEGWWESTKVLCLLSSFLFLFPLPSWLNGVVKEDTFVSSNLLSHSFPPALSLSYYFMIIRVVYRAVDSDDSCAQASTSSYLLL